MTLTKSELQRRRQALAYKEMKAAMIIAMEKVTKFEKEMGEGIVPSPTLSQKPGLSEERIADFMAASRARRGIPFPPDSKQ